MIKYEIMRAHGKGSEGSAKKGGGCEKKGEHAAQAPPPVYATGYGRPKQARMMTKKNEREAQKANKCDRRRQHGLKKLSLASGTRSPDGGFP